eukprot:13513999-Alexandrium_andersonii.AAC.1
MSASLVGSEMCIRDRPPRRQGVRHANVQTDPIFGLAPPLGAGEVDPCLLYTSDAADDMQCRS